MSVLAVATITNKKTNQDACAAVLNQRAGIAALIVADGVGSHYGAEIASAAAVEALREELDRISDPSSIDLRNLFSKAAEALGRKVSAITEQLPPGLNENNAFGTTLICAVETEDSIRVGYVGNGGILRIRGDFTEFPDSCILPWCVVNYLSPHSISLQGKNALDRIVSAYAMPVALQTDQLDFTKDERYGDAVVLCTDGIYSPDQVPVGLDENGSVWMSVEPALLLLLDYLKKFFAAGRHDSARLQESLDQYLADLQRRGLVEDDCTVAVLITDQALNFQHSRQSKKEVTG
jgi:serine/threonine protein phosphatase PrpC